MSAALWRLLNRRRQHVATNTLSMLALGRLINAALSAVTSKCTRAARDAFEKAYLALVETEAIVKAAERSVA